MKSSNSRYWVEFSGAMALFLAAVFVSRSLLPQTSSALPRVCLALLPVVPAILVAVAMTRRIRALDELERQIEIEAVVVASLLTGMGSFAAGFLAAAQLVHIPVISVFPTMIALYTIAKSWAAWRYR